MSTERRPLVSIGLPVYNGENYLERALDGIQAQTFQDFEVVISDNASTDRTEALCRERVACDPRFSYVRQSRNLGVPGNFNQVFLRSKGKYFHWLAHDDLCQPTYLERCVAALDGDEDAIVAYPRAASIDHNEARIKSWPSRPDLDSVDPVFRYREMLVALEPFVIFGLMRADVLRSTSLYGSFWCADFALLAELALLGRFIEIPEELFLLRQHGERSTFVYDWHHPERATALWNPESPRPFLAPHWKLLLAQASAVRRARLRPAQKALCYRDLLRHWSGTGRRAELLYDTRVSIQQLPVIGDLVRKSVDAWVDRRWTRRVRRATGQVRGLARASDIVIFVDQATFPEAELAGLRAVPFLEKDGRYWGCPADDVTAVDELERARANGARYLAVAWPAFWWFEHYHEWGKHVRSRFARRLETEDVVVYDLQQPASG